MGPRRRGGRGGSSCSASGRRAAAAVAGQVRDRTSAQCAGPRSGRPLRTACRLRPAFVAGGHDGEALTPQALLGDLLSIECSPELAADLGVGWLQAPRPAGAAAAAALGDGQRAGGGPGAGEGEGRPEGSEEALPSQAPGRHAALVRASQTLLHKMAHFQALEEDSVAQLSAAEAAIGAQAFSGPAWPRRAVPGSPHLNADEGAMARSLARSFARRQHSPCGAPQQLRRRAHGRRAC